MSVFSHDCLIFIDFRLSSLAHAQIMKWLERHKTDGIIIFSMALCSKEPSAGLAAPSFSLELPQKHLEDCSSIFKRISVNKKKKLMCPTGTGADQNRNLEPLLGLLGIS